MCFEILILKEDQMQAAFQSVAKMTLTIFHACLNNQFFKSIGNTNTNRTNQGFR